MSKMSTLIVAINSRNEIQFMPVTDEITILSKYEDVVCCWWSKFVATAAITVVTKWKNEKCRAVALNIGHLIYLFFENVIQSGSAVAFGWIEQKEKYISNFETILFGAPIANSLNNSNEFNVSNTLRQDNWIFYTKNEMRSIQPASQAACVCVWNWLNSSLISTAMRRTYTMEINLKSVSFRSGFHWMNREKEKWKINQIVYSLWAFMHLLWKQFSIEFRSALSLFFLWYRKMGEVKWSKKKKTVKRIYIY